MSKSCPKRSKLIKVGKWSGVIPNKSGRLVLYGNIDFGQFWTILFPFWETLDLTTKQTFNIVSNQFPSGERIEMAIGSFHGFGEPSI